LSGAPAGVVERGKMGWIEATLRGQRVFARANEDRTLAADATGRVEVRYKATDARAYRASARNLVVADGAVLHPDGAVAPAPPASLGERSKQSESGPGLSPGWIAYTDGACSGNPGPAGSGVVLVSPDGKMHEGLEYLGEATNNVAELTGILRAIEWSPSEVRGLVVHTDSQYAIGVLQKGWRPKANRELVAVAKEAVQERRARLVYVPGHQGVSLNERADELAREAIRTRAKRRPSL
jgi:ribonuclease HI